MVATFCTTQGWRNPKKHSKNNGVQLVQDFFHTTYYGNDHWPLLRILILYCFRGFLLWIIVLDYDMFLNMENYGLIELKYWEIYLLTTHSNSNHDGLVSCFLANWIVMNWTINMKYDWIWECGLCNGIFSWSGILLEWTMEDCLGGISWIFLSTILI